MAGGQFHLDPGTYLAAVRADVAAYDAFQEAVADATAGVEVGRVLELGIGTGETARRVLQRHAGAHLVAIDASGAMVHLAAAALPHADVRVGRLEEALPEGPFDVVVSALAVHHLPAAGKADLFVRVAERLRPGGRFVLGDVVIPARADDAAIPLEAGVDLPERVPDLVGWLAAAALEVAVAWQHADLAVLTGDRRAG